MKILRPFNENLPRYLSWVNAKMIKQKPKLTKIDLVLVKNDATNKIMKIDKYFSLEKRFKFFEKIKRIGKNIAKTKWNEISVLIEKGPVKSKIYLLPV